MSSARSHLFEISVSFCILATNLLQPPAGDDLRSDARFVAETSAALTEHPTIQAMLAENNRLRAAAGLKPQLLDPKLTSAAQEKANAMAAAHRMSHGLAGGHVAGIARWEYAAASSGENIAYGYANVTAAFKGWRHSRGHWANMSANFRDVGFGHQVDERGVAYWAAIYASPRSQ